MHKFTIFTIILSIMVILVVADLVVGDFSNPDSSEQAPVVATSAPLFDPDPLVEDAEIRTDEPAVDAEVELAETSVVAVPALEQPLSGHLTAELIEGMSLVEPRLETEALVGPLFGLWDVTTPLAGFVVLAHQVFDGPNFVATVFEIQGDNEIQTFAAYEALRQLALTSPLGTVNENNNYGDGSFYFNHSTKLNTVFMVIRKGMGVYAFQYAPPSHHTFVRPLIDKL